MARAVLSAKRVLSAAGTSDRKLVESALESSKAELASWVGDDLTIEATPDRLDLLCEGGLGLHVAGVLDKAVGIPAVARAFDISPLEITVSESVDPLRPSIAGVALESPPDQPLDDGLLDEAVRYQELLHATVGGDRRRASLGIYPLDQIRSPVQYSLEAIEALRFVPLGETSEVSGVEFFQNHPMAQKFGALGRENDKCLVLRDAGGSVLSLPPVLNARPAGEATAGMRRLLLESTGTGPARVQDGLSLFTQVFVARGWRVAPVKVRAPTGVDDGRQVIEPRKLSLSARDFAVLTGFEVRAAEVARLLARSRLDAAPSSDGWTVSVPPWRPDVLGAVDLVEDAVLARGVRGEDAILLPSPTRGRRRPESRWRIYIERLLLGLGFQPLHTPVLVPNSAAELLGRRTALSVANPVSELFARVRDSLLLAHVGTLARNTRRPYPQRFCEVGPVVIPSTSTESGGDTRYHAGVMIVEDSAGFADAAAIVDYLMGRLGAHGVREPTEIPGTIPGRSARIRLAGEPVAEVGEILPTVLAALGVPVPAAWAELDLTALWPLFRKDDTTPTGPAGARAP